MAIGAGVITIIIMIVGVVGNSLTIAALWRNSKIRTVAAAFIANLCISDLLICFLSLPFGASQFINAAWDHGDLLCTLVPLIRYGNVGVSLLSIAMISINRYILIARPQFYDKIYTKLNVAIYICIIWTFSYSMQIPTLLRVWGEFGIDKNSRTCTITEDKNGRNSKTTLFAIAFAVPCIIIIICYAKIYLVVKESQRNLEKHCSRGGTKRSEMRVTKMVLIIFVCFLVCYLPISIVKFSDPKGKHKQLHIFGNILLYLSSCLNPLVYVTMNKQYRRAYLDTLMCRFSNNYDSTSPVQQ